MNRENILRVADAIEKGELVKRGIGFNMEFFYCPSPPPSLSDHFHKCGTVACIGGWAKAILEPDEPLADREGHAAKLLGLDGGRANDLFYADSADIHLSDITPAHAVAVLRHLAETGEVDWSVGAP